MPHYTWRVMLRAGRYSGTKAYRWPGTRTG